MAKDEREEAEELWSELNNAYRHPADGAPWFKGLAADVLMGWNSPEEVVAYLVWSFEEWNGSKALPEQVAHVMRDVVGNPFRPVALATEWAQLTPRCHSLARCTKVRKRLQAAMPILADALQDAGCDTADILDHGRGSSPHVRGCWVVDLVLGKE